PRLVVGGAGSAEVPGDACAGHERLGGLGGHLRPVVGQGEQHGQLVTVGHDTAAQLVEQAVVFEEVVLAVGDQRAGERDLDLGGGLLGRDHCGQPQPGDHVQDRDRAPAGGGKVGEVVDPDDPGDEL